MNRHARSLWQAARVNSFVTTNDEVNGRKVECGKRLLSAGDRSHNVSHADEALFMLTLKVETANRRLDGAAANCDV